ncbi:uncharacterized protein FFMR_00238 [Fusarium fujikuroi]|nr:uncharacterized protein FFMR_00238 [Fusarium fujikuroi]SCO47601.1 uncharacterized protein FFNC_11667 [Fusarium fujikuroi]SCV50851.1 uncharacterized protein FFB14_11671 [Fusarium fujikuroi]VTT75052.1 unnamed protein product [Fusarium fujikuroi]
MDLSKAPTARVMDHGLGRYGLRAVSVQCAWAPSVVFSGSEDARSVIDGTVLQYESEACDMSSSGIP